MLFVVDEDDGDRVVLTKVMILCDSSFGLNVSTVAEGINWNVVGQEAHVDCHGGCAVKARHFSPHFLPASFLLVPLLTANTFVHSGQEIFCTLRYCSGITALHHAFDTICTVERVESCGERQRRDGQAAAGNV